MHKAFPEVGLGCGDEEEEEEQGPVCVKSLNCGQPQFWAGGKEGREFVKMTVSKKTSNIQSCNTVSCYFLMEANTGWSGSAVSGD